MQPRGIVVLGATGSVGRSTLNVIRQHPGEFRVVALTANSNAEALDRLAVEYDPDFVVVASGTVPGKRRWPGEWRFGAAGVTAAAGAEAAAVVVNGLVGAAGLEPTLAALSTGKRLALANKESLVVGGELVLQACGAGGELIPVDSEHSAVFQCLQSRPSLEVARVILTASGGPFRTTPAARFETIRPVDALAHPTWNMGSKISIDSATLANKALEVIEAHYLFDLPYERIEVVVHPASIVHCMLEFRDGSTLAQLGFPTMELPIRYALFYPERVAGDFRPFDPVAASPLTFEPVREEAFPMLRLGLEAGRSGGTHPAVFNAANEVAVQAFLDGDLGFPGIPRVVETTLADCPSRRVAGLSDLWSADVEARDTARRAIGNLGAPTG